MKKQLLTLITIFSIALFALLILGRNLNYPLMSYDEAWYAAISKDILHNGNIFFQHFNGYAYYDHPPMGFWLMTISMWIFGNNEIAVRLPSMIAGALSLIFIYLLARRRTNNWFGLGAAVMLASSLWFTYRIRSGNLDAPLVCFFLSSYYFAETWFKDKHDRFAALGMMASLTGLVLIKTLVGFGIVPALAVAYLFADGKKRPSIFMVALSLVGVGMLCYPWYWFNKELYPGFIHYHFVSIGTREGVQNITWEGIQQTLLYLRSGIGRWYYPAMASVGLSVALILGKRFKQKLLISDLVLALSIGIPFFKSPKTEVWHLIPLYAPLYLLLITVSWSLIRLFKHKYTKALTLVVFVGIMGVGLQQCGAVMKVLSENAGRTEADIAKKAQEIPGPVYLNAPFLPAFVYYSNQEFVVPLQLEANSYEIMRKLLLNPTFTSTIVTTIADKKLFDRDNIPYRVYDENREYTIIMSTPNKEKL